MLNVVTYCETFSLRLKRKALEDCTFLLNLSWSHVFLYIYIYTLYKWNIKYILHLTGKRIVIGYFTHSKQFSSSMEILLVYHSASCLYTRAVWRPQLGLENQNRSDSVWEFSCPAFPSIMEFYVCLCGTWEPSVKEEIAIRVTRKSKCPIISQSFMDSVVSDMPYRILKRWVSTGIVRSIRENLNPWEALIMKTQSWQKLQKERIWTVSNLGKFSWPCATSISVHS